MMHHNHLLLTTPSDYHYNLVICLVNIAMDAVASEINGTGKDAR